MPVPGGPCSKITLQRIVGTQKLVKILVNKRWKFIHVYLFLTMWHMSIQISTLMSCMHLFYLHWSIVENKCQSTHKSHFIFNDFVMRDCIIYHFWMTDTACHISINRLPTTNQWHIDARNLPSSQVQQMRHRKNIKHSHFTLKWSMHKCWVDKAHWKVLLILMSIPILFQKRCLSFSLEEQCHLFFLDA